jgi:hypothetical protein
VQTKDGNKYALRWIVHNSYDAWMQVLGQPQKPLGQIWMRPWLARICATTDLSWCAPKVPEKRAYVPPPPGDIDAEIEIYLRTRSRRNRYSSPISACAISSPGVRRCMPLSTVTPCSG